MSFGSRQILRSQLTDCLNPVDDCSQEHLVANEVLLPAGSISANGLDHLENVKQEVSIAIHNAIDSAWIPLRSRRRR